MWLDGLICNAGSLLNNLTFTCESIETTLACQLFYGTYLLIELALNGLQVSANSRGGQPRVIIVSAGAMYCTFYLIYIHMYLYDLLLLTPHSPQKRYMYYYSQYMSDHI